MNGDIAEIVKWARSQGWDVVDDAKGYTRFYNPQGVYITNRRHRAVRVGGWPT